LRSLLIALQKNSRVGQIRRSGWKEALKPAGRRSSIMLAGLFYEASFTSFAGVNLNLH